MGLASAGRDSLLRKRVAFIDRVPSADNKPNGRNPEHQAKYREKQPTCLLNAVVHCSLLSGGVGIATTPAGARFLKLPYWGLLR